MLKWTVTIKRLQARRSSSGQVAVMFVALIALIIALAAFTMNLGEVARLKTSTANAADAGALAAASWVASGENEVAKIAQGMWINVYLVQAVFLIPFCMQVCYWAIILMLVLALVNGVILRGIAEDILDSTWDLAQAEAFFVGVQNLLIDDDESTKVSDRLKAMGDEFQKNQQLLPPTPCPAVANAGAQCLQWERTNPSDKASPRKHWVAIQTKFPNQRPKLEMGDWGPWALCLLWWPTCSSNGGGCCLNTPWGCVWPCFRMPRAWVRWSSKGTASKPSNAAAMTAGQKVWSMASSGLVRMAGFLPKPSYTGTCGFCLPIPLNIPKLPTEPKRIDHGEDDVTVTVQYHREGGAVKGGGGVSFWTTRYPNIITSDATGHYTAASVGSFGSLPDSRAVADLKPGSTH